jgi:mRNA interferase MazF
MKDFCNWHNLKINIDSKIEEKRLFFKEAEVWWVHLGLNIGFEMNGKDKDFRRPVVIIKKYNRFSFLALPLTTVKKESKYSFCVGKVSGKDAYANLSQLRSVDSKRLVRKVGFIRKEQLYNLKKKLVEINFD